MGVVVVENEIGWCWVKKEGCWVCNRLIRYLLIIIGYVSVGSVGGE